MIRKPTEDVLFHIQSTLQYTEVKEPKQIHEQGIYDYSKFR